MAYLAMDSNLVPSSSWVFQLFACAARLDQYRALSGNLFFADIVHFSINFCTRL